MENNSEKICPKCQTANPIAANFCRHCGEMFQSAHIAKSEKEDNSLTDALRKKIISLQEEIKEYDERERLWQIKARNWFDKENREKAQKEELQREIRSLRLERNIMMQEEHRRNQSSQRKFTSKMLIIFIISISGSFLLGYLSHKYITLGLHQNKEDLSQEINVAAINDIDSNIIKNQTQLDQEFEKYVLVDSGTLYNYGYVYGLDDDFVEQTVENIKIDSYYISKYDVIQYDYERLMRENPSSQKNDSFPAMGMRFIDALKYCNELSKTNGYDGFYSINGDSVLFNIHGNGFRLPTKYEYAFAARDRKKNAYKYAAGDNLSEIAWHAGNSKGKVHKIAQKKCNELGLYDMVGNVYKYLWSDDSPRINVWYAGGSYQLYSYSKETFREYYNVGGGDYDDVGIRLVFVPRNMLCKNVPSKGWYKVRQRIRIE